MFKYLLDRVQQENGRIIYQSYQELKDTSGLSYYHYIQIQIIELSIWQMYFSSSPEHLNF